MGKYSDVRVDRGYTPAQRVIEENTPARRPELLLPKPASKRSYRFIYPADQ